ncbi:DUF4179 domain-containing protein [Brevibacillus panacihumi]|uniref:DUF4179 domain-containing protein n=1 Tax=Brevibacillus panacihumi TaxID=497735 RepID=A0A3M8CHD7_9BACL|nr:DUF4179 domain-containing protein [Brevibacillus panacihumi]RNB75068.1 DUF4179 domain-containing protein [Brevibacillus panacihumi]
MKCSRTDALRAYMNGELSEMESRLLERHVERCLSCQLQMETEEDWEPGDLQVQSELPPDFSQKVMQAVEDLPVPVPKPDWKKRSVTILKRTTVAVASVAALITFTSMVSPTFASYVNSVIQSIQGVDKGMKQAAENGYAQEINKQTTDQGITLIVKEVVADPMRIAIFCDVLDQQGNRISTTSIQGDDIRLVFKEKEGAELHGGGGSTISQRGEYLVLNQEIFSFLPDPTDIPDELFVGVHAASLKGKQGNWLIEFPVDMKKAKAHVTYTDINQQYTTPQGISLRLNRMMTVPSASLLELETDWTKERTEQVEAIMKENGWEAGEPERGKISKAEIMQGYFKRIGLAYQIIDEHGKVIAGWDDALYDEVNQIKANTVDLTRRGVEAPNENRITAWNGFAPFADNQKLNVKLHSLYLFEPAAFKAQVPVDTLINEQVTIDSQDNLFSLTGFLLKTTEQEERIGDFTYRGIGAIIPFSAKLPDGIVYTSEWKAKDEKGKEYPVSRNEAYRRGEDGRVEVKGSLYIRGLDHQPKTLVLSYEVQQRQYRDLDWEVPIKTGN